jgi:hypothetical protein
MKGTIIGAGYGTVATGAVGGGGAIPTAIGGCATAAICNVANQVLFDPSYVGRPPVNPTPLYLRDWPKAEPKNKSYPAPNPFNQRCPVLY